MSIYAHLRIAGTFAALAIASDAYADVTITEKPGHTTEGVVTVDATPSQVYDLVTDYAKWKSILGDVISVTVKSGGRENATVRFKSRTLQHEVTVIFDNIADHRIAFRGIDGPPGGRASGSYTLTPIDGGHRTLVTAELYLDVVGAPSLFVRDRTIRSMRQAKLRADLADVAKHFAGSPLSQRSGS